MGPGSNMVLGPVEFQPDWVTVEFETGFTPFFKLFKVNRLFLTALVRSWLALLYTLHKLTSPCSCQKWPTLVGYQRQASISLASDFKLDHKG